MSEAGYQAVDPPLRKYRKHKICIGVSICCTVVWLGIAIGFPFLLASLIDSQAKSGIVMTPDNENLWAHIPGGTNTITYRNFTFFNFTNPREFLYQGKKPLFREVSGYSYIEKQDFINIEYLDDGNEVKYDYWLHFEESSTTRNLNQKVKVINLGPVGFWNQLKSTDMPTFAIQGFGQLTFELRSTFKSTVLGQGVAQQFLPNQTNWLPLADSAGVSSKVASFLWTDLQYGLNNPSNYEIWLAAAKDRFSADYRILINYFGLEPSQMKVILDQMSSWVAGLTGIIDNWFCGNSTDCNDQFLTFLQLSSSGVTANPPPGTAPTDSICQQNVTCVGWPEISSYLKHVFPEQYPRSTECFNLTFTVEEMRRWMLPTKEPYCLLHTGNMNYLWEAGRKFDKTLDVQLLLNITQRFQLSSLNHAFVMWNWVKYVTYEFVLKQQKQGTRGIAGIGGVSSQAFYGVFSAVENWLPQFLLLTKVSNKISAIYQTCQGLAREVMGGITDDQIAVLCKDVSMDRVDTLLGLANICEFEFGLEWKKAQTSAKFSDVQMTELCDQDNPSLGYILKISHAELAQFYNCSLGDSARCSNYEITLRQWARSQVTRNPIPELDGKLYPAAQTVKAWNSEIPEYEYTWFLDLIGSNSTWRPSLTNMVELVSFDCLFSGPVIQQIMLTLDDASFAKKYNWSEPALLRSYLKFVAIEVGLGGLTQERSPKELVLGYEDDFLRNLRDMDPAMGGDPSINIVVAINEPNSTEEQAKRYPISMHTGKDNYNNTRYYNTINGVPYTNVNYSYWNGDTVVGDIKSPWTQLDYFVGTDAFQAAPGVKPQKDGNNISVYISSLYRYGQAFYNETITKFDMDVYIARIDPSLFQNQWENPVNAKYYATYSGFLNITSVAGAPLFISKNHFLDCPKNWSQFIDVYDEHQTFIYEASIYDDTFLQLEPNTGTSFGATIYLQTSYNFQMDELFERNQTLMLPVFSIWRAGNISDAAVEEYFGPLKIGFTIKRLTLPIGLTLSGLCLLIGIGVYLHMKRAKKQQAGTGASERKDPDLMISLQPQGEQNSRSGQPKTEIIQQPKIEEEKEQQGPGRNDSLMNPLNASTV